jgi:hypothetical protein
MGISLEETDESDGYVPEPAKSKKKSLGVMKPVEDESDDGSTKEVSDGEPAKTPSRSKTRPKMAVEIPLRRMGRKSGKSKTTSDVVEGVVS